MMYKITVIKTKGSNYEKVEVGMNVEIGSNEFVEFRENNVKPFTIRNNKDLLKIGEAFKKKYGIDLQKDGILVYPTDRYFKCEKL